MKHSWFILVIGGLLSPGLAWAEEQHGGQDASAPRPRGAFCPVRPSGGRKASEGGRTGAGDTSSSLKPHLDEGRQTTDASGQDTDASSAAGAARAPARPRADKSNGSAPQTTNSGETGGVSGAPVGRQGARHVSPRPRPGEPDEDSGRKPFSRPPRRSRFRHWSMSLDVGVALPVPASDAPAKAGVSLTVRGGWRFLHKNSVSLYLGLQTSVVSLRKKETVVLNPEADADEQVGCRDYKEFNAWTMAAGLWLQAQRSRMVFGLGAAAGAGFVEQRQLKRRSDDPKVLTCGFDRATVWTPMVVAWGQLGWRFSPGVLATVTGGFRGLFSDKRFVYLDSDETVQDRPLVFHVPFVAVSLIHRF